MPPPSTSSLRRFASIVVGCLSIISTISWMRGHVVVPAILGSVAALLGLAGLIAPRSLVPVERIWLWVGGVLAWVNTRILLTVLFYIVVTPLAFLIRSFRDPLDRRFNRSTASYWIARPAAIGDAKSYERQF